MQDLSEWLRVNGFGRYVDLFVQNDIDASVLHELTDGHLKELGLPLGTRIKLLKAIADLGYASANMSAHGAEPSGAAPRPEAERRQLTVMFVDLVGSTPLARQLDPEDMRAVIAAFQNVVARVVNRFDGHVAHYMGDGVLCYFGWPRAHEDDAERAARAGLAAVESVARLRAPDGRALCARVGIATGLVVVGDLIGEGAAQQEAVVGDTPNLAARLQARAEPGQVVVAASTRALLAEALEVAALGPQSLKGIEGTTAAYAVLAERQVTSRFDARAPVALAPMVGRDHELGLVLEKWQQAQRGDGQFVVLTGEAGIGKSRVVRALIDAAGRVPHHRISQQCSPYFTDSALYPVIQQLTFATGIEAGDDNDTKLAKLERLITGNGDARRLLAALLGIDAAARYGGLDLPPEQQRAQTLRALCAQLVALSRERPVLWVLEDLHWSDATTLELVELCLEEVARAPVLVLATARPAFEHGFGGHPIVTRLTLNRLGRDQVTSIVDKLAGGKALPEPLIQEIIQRTDGVPLFVEELTKAILESGRLSEAAEAFELRGTLEQLEIPATLHDSLMARLDRLQPVKEVAQIAACIGREFDLGLLRAIVPFDAARLQHALDQLESAELVFRRHHADEAAYTFKHALVRDAAYESLLKARRQAIHARLTDELEVRPGTPPELIAHHATRGELHEKAIHYWREAGIAALARPAYQEAIGHFRNALALIARADDGRERMERELDLLVLMAQAMIPKFGWSAEPTVQTYARGLELVERLGKTPNRFPVLFGVWVGHLVRSEVAPLMARAESILGLAEEDGGEIPSLMARRFAGVSHWMAGSLDRARSDLDYVLGIYRPDAHGPLAERFGQDPGAQTLGYICNLYWVLGLVEEAFVYADAAEQAAAASSHLTTALDVSWNLCTFAMCARDDERLERPLQRLLTMSARYNLANFREVAECVEGIRRGRLGDPTGVARFDAAYSILSACGVRIYMPFFLAEQARGLVVLGRNADARRQIDLALDLVEETGERWAAAEIQRIAGEIRLAEGDLSAAEACFGRALDTARRQGAKSWELRASTSLARLWAAHGHRRQARELLVSAINGFGDRAAASDLIDARQLSSEFG